MHLRADNEIAENESSETDTSDTDTSAASAPISTTVESLLGWMGGSRRSEVNAAPSAAAEAAEANDPTIFRGGGGEHIQAWQFNSGVPRWLPQRWGCVHFVAQWFVINMAAVINWCYEDNLGGLPQSHKFRDSSRFEFDLIRAQFAAVLIALDRVIEEVVYFQGYGALVHRIYDRLMALVDDYSKDVRFLKIDNVLQFDFHNRFVFCSVDNERSAECAARYCGCARQ